MSEDSDLAIGIDLGTTYSCVAVWKHNEKVTVFANEQGNRTTPSCVAFYDNKRLVGEAAKNQAAWNTTNTIFDVKRLIGRRFDEPEVKDDMKHWPFTVINKDGAPYIQVEYHDEKRDFSPQDISAMVLAKMKELAEERIGETVTKAVITVPARFNDAQRNATKDAGVIAGLDVLRIINEPTAAALAYGWDSKDTKEKKVLIFDLGGGTFDVSVLSIVGGILQVKATDGDTHLGGEDFDIKLLEHFKEEFRCKHGKDISGDPRAVRRLRTACERAKRTLSARNQTTLEVDSLFEGIDFEASITRTRFEELNSTLFQNTIDYVERVLKDAKYTKRDIDDVVLVGGSTRIPKIQSLLQEFFDGKELNKSINPDEAVAYGAAVLAAVLTGQAGNDKTQGLLLLDIVPLNLGIELEGGVMGVVVPRNTTIPTEMTKTFTTVRDGQMSVLFAVHEGKRPMTRDNNLLGEFELYPIPPLPRGMPELLCTFDVDANGILKVSAMDKLTGLEENITISNMAGRLPVAEFQRSIADAKRFKDEDRQQERIEKSKQDFEAYIHQVEDTLRRPNARTKMTPSDRMAVEIALEEAVAMLQIEELAENDTFVVAQRNLRRSVSKPFASLSR
ncbi:Heat shock cognate 71 kDa protein [Mortierella sp. NVP85]|nr:Heat shock cognate 71 kDa protein [Mortierella sp. NVP85]